MANNFENKKYQSVAKHLLEDEDILRSIIFDLTGKNVNQLDKMSKDELLSYLSHLLAEKKKEDIFLHWRHNKCIPDYMLNSHQYVLQARGLTNRNDKIYEFGTKKYVFDALKIAFANRCARQLDLLSLENISSSVISDPFNVQRGNIVSHCYKKVEFKVLDFALSQTKNNCQKETSVCIYT